MSETALCRGRLSEFCQGHGMDIGFGGDTITRSAITFDKPNPYTNVGDCPQHLSGDCRELPFRNGTLDFIYSSHLIEDFKYEEQVPIIREWLRVLRKNGRIIIYCPDEAIYSAHCRESGQPYNHAHKNKDYSLKTFKENVLSRFVDVKILHENHHVEVYSWEIVFEKL